MFGKKSKEIAPIQQEKIETVDLNNVIFIDITINNKRFQSRFFMGKRVNNINSEIIIGHKDMSNIHEKNTVMLVFNLINAERYSQTGYISKVEEHKFTIELNDDIQKLQERRVNLKISCNLTGDICVMNQDLYIDITNISIGGVFIKAEYDFTPKNIYSIYIKELDVSGKVKILRKQMSGDTIEGYGCQFIDLSDRNQEKIFMYINALMQKERQTLLTRDVYNYMID